MSDVMIRCWQPSDVPDLQEIFSVSFGIARAMQGGQLDIISIAVNPFLEVVFSLLLGGILGAVLSELEKLFQKSSETR